MAKKKSKRAYTSKAKRLAVPDIQRGYTLVKAPSRGPIDAWELVVFSVIGGEYNEIKRFPENLREVIFRDIEDDILRDA